MLVHAGAVWSRLVAEVAQEFPDVTVDYLHVDAATIFMTTDPARFDVIVTDNLFGDIITDLAAAITGGIGLAASGNINPDRTAPSMFEPVHGSAPDIAGQQKADPTAAILSAALLLDHLGLEDAARRVEEAVLADLADRPAARAVPPRSATPSPPGSPGRRRAADRKYRARHERARHHGAPATPTRSTTTGSPRSSATPGSAELHRPHVHVEWTPEQGWHDARITAYGPITLDPATAVLHYAQEIFEGLKAYRHADGSVWTFRPEVNAARMQRSARRLALPELPVEDFLASVDALVEVDERWVPGDEGEKSLYLRPFMFASEAFLGVRPAKHVTYMVIASPAGAYFPGGIKPVSILVSEHYTRAAVGGMGAAKTGGNYASSLAPQQEAIDQRLRPGGLPRRDRADVRRGARRHEPLLRPRRRHDRHPRAHRHDPRGRHPLLDHGARRRRWATRSRSAGSPSTSGATASPSGRITEVFACGTAAVVTPVGRLAWRDGEVDSSVDGDAGPVTPRIRAGARRHPVRPRRGHVRLDAPRRLSRRWRLP